MIKNYIKIAYRNLVRNKIYSFINIGGLAVGMAVAMLISLWIYDELTFNTHHKNYDRIAQVMQHQTFNGVVGTERSLPIMMGDELKKSYGSDFKYIAMSSWFGDHILSFGEKKISKEGGYMDVDAPKIFSLNMLKGNQEGLKDPNSILISEGTAKALFGHADAMEQVLKIDNNHSVKVTGVYEDLPFKSDLASIGFLAPWQLYVSTESWVRKYQEEKNWGSNSWQCYVQIADNGEMDRISNKIKNAKFDKVPEREKQFKAEIFLHAMADWHLRDNWEGRVHTGGFIEYVWLFGIIGLFVLLLACINFMNLSTARSEKRAREVGVRKAIGSYRRQLIYQFLSESYLVVGIAFCFSVCLTLLALPYFNDITEKQISFPFGEPVFWFISLLFILVTGLLAGSYPAIYLSSFQPVQVLKGTFKIGKWASIPRKVLVVSQFAVSVVLIIGTLIINEQVQFTKNRPLGYDNKNLIMVQMSSPDFKGKFDVLRNELKRNGSIIEMSESSSPMTGNWSNNGGFQWQGKAPNLQDNFAFVWTTHEYGKTAGWTIKEGRDFSREFATDTSAFLINESAVKFMGITEPVGKTVRWGDEKHGKDYTIIGVVKDILAESPYEPVKQTIYAINQENTNWINLKLNPNKSASTSILLVESVFKKHIPATPFDYKFVDEEFDTKFKAEERVGRLYGIFSFLAIFISCLGIFGLASFVAEQRTKEIGIRKVVGASVFSLWKMLSKDFVVLVMISWIIATPISYYFMENWLQQYTYRINISAWIFVTAAICALFITLLTVSYQAIKASIANPIKSLKTE
ncbi:MAG: ABC transporter permease [Saprospiraceae bacterium]|nr:ABC transporter permease [Saprospiraceae bacterium]